MNAPRAYRDERDLHAMHSLLTAGRKANNGSYYIHTGDLDWWLYYPPLEGAYWDDIHLWDDPAHPGRLLAWSLIAADWVAMDVYVQPELRGSPLAEEIYRWTEDKAMEIARQRARKTVHVVWVLHEDDLLCRHFADRGFRLARGYVQMTRSLEDEIPYIKIQGDFQVRGCMGEFEAESRAKAQYGAFGSSAPFEAYLERFRSFMRSPVYNPEYDIVAAAPDGQICAFCIVWMDPVNQVGHFEPVGTHPDFQRRGLGKAVMLEGLRRMQERGMRSADISTLEDNPAAIHLYESLGFHLSGRLGTYEKDV